MNSEILSPASFIEAFFDRRYRCTMVGNGRCLSGRDWTLGPRAIPDHLIHYIESGGYLYQLGKKTFELKPKQLLWIQPGVQHRFFQNPKEDKTANLFIRFYLGKKTPLRLKTDYLLCNDDAHYYGILTEMLPEYRVPGPSEAYRLRALLASLACYVLKEPEQTAAQAAGFQGHQKKLILTFIYQNLSRRHPIAELAAQVKMNPVYFSRKFKDTFGTTPQDWIKRERIRLATSLLRESSYSISEIAAQLGYDEVFFFSRQFKEVMKVSPLQWRAANR
jgi:AraC-like DNA-binding protein